MSATAVHRSNVLMSVTVFPAALIKAFKGSAAVRQRNAEATNSVIEKSMFFSRNMMIIKNARMTPMN